MVAAIPDKTAESARDAFAKYRVRYFGLPELLVSDQGTEFTEAVFGNYVGEGGTLLHFIDSQSPWQNGRTERAGGSFKEDLRDVITGCAITTTEEFELAVTHALDARNRYVNRSGFSAHQRVCGSSLRLPGSVLSDDPIDSSLVSEDPSTEFRRSEEIRRAANRALFKRRQ